MEPIELSGNEYLELLDTGRGHEELSVMHGITSVWVDFSATDPGGAPSGKPAPTSRRNASFTTLPSIVVALNDGTGAWSAVSDVQLDTDDVRRFSSDLRLSIAGNPLAATTLALHLRGSESRSVEQGLVAESVTYSLLQGGPEFARWLAGRGDRPVSTSVEDAVVLELTDDRLQITLNRPDRHNVFSRAMRDELVSALMIPLIDGELRVELSGRGKSFCSGGDLAEFGSFASPVESHLTRLTRSPAWLLAQLATRTTAVLHGACYGAGVELPSFVGHVVAAPDTRFCLPEITLGLIPGAGGTVSLPRRIGRHRTALLGLSGSVIDASTALTWGLIDRIGSSDSV